jgi:hypothetical protein
MSAAQTERISVKSDIGDFYGNREIPNLVKIWKTKISRTLHERSGDIKLLFVFK